METAMQLMLEDLELRYKVLYDAEMLQACAAIEGTIEYAKSLILKEKKQIIDACNSAFEDKTTWGERYYNQTFK